MSKSERRYNPKVCCPCPELGDRDWIPNVEYKVTPRRSTRNARGEYDEDMEKIRITLQKEPERKRDDSASPKTVSVRKTRVVRERSRSRSRSRSPAPDVSRRSRRVTKQSSYYKPEHSFRPSTYTTNWVNKIKNLGSFSVDAADYTSKPLHRAKKVLVEGIMSITASIGVKDSRKVKKLVSRLVTGVIAFILLFVVYEGYQYGGSAVQYVRGTGRFMELGSQEQAVLDKKLAELKSAFIGQDRDSWNYVNAAVRSVLNPSPYRPAVILFAFPKDTLDIADCFMQHLMTSLAEIFHESKVTVLDLATTQKTRTHLDYQYHSALNNGHIMHIKNVNSMNRDTAWSLLSWADHEEAPYKQAVLLLSMTINDTSDFVQQQLGKKNIEDISEYYLEQDWKFSMIHEDKRAVLARINNAVFLLRPDRPSICHL